MAGLGLPHAALREQVADAFDLVVCQARAADGARRVVAVAEVVRVAGGPAARELYAWRGGRGRWRAALTDGLAARLAAVGDAAQRERRDASLLAFVRGRRPPRVLRRVGGARGGRALARGRRARAGGRAARARRPRGPGADARRSGAGSRCSPPARSRPPAGCSAAWRSRVLAAVAGPALVVGAVRARRRRYARALRTGAAGAARALADAVGAGHSIRGAIAVAADGHRRRGRPRAARDGPRARARRADRGRARAACAAAPRDPAWDAIVAGILLQRDAGGDLAGLLRDQAAALEAADRIGRDARAATAQARFTARLVLAAARSAPPRSPSSPSPGLIAGLLAHPLSVWLVAMAAVLAGSTAILAVARAARRRAR